MKTCKDFNLPDCLECLLWTEYDQYSLSQTCWLQELNSTILNKGILFLIDDLSRFSDLKSDLPYIKCVINEYHPHLINKLETIILLK